MYYILIKKIFCCPYIILYECTKTLFQCTVLNLAHLNRKKIRSKESWNSLTLAEKNILFENKYLLKETLCKTDVTGHPRAFDKNRVCTVQVGSSIVPVFN